MKQRTRKELPVQLAGFGVVGGDSGVGGGHHLVVVSGDHDRALVGGSDDVAAVGVDVEEHLPGEVVGGHPVVHALDVGRRGTATVSTYGRVLGSPFRETHRLV